MTIDELITRGSFAIDRSPDAIKSKSRLTLLVITRHAIADIACRNGYTYQQIALSFNMKQRATITNCRRRASEMQGSKNSQFLSIYNSILNPA